MKVSRSRAAALVSVTLVAALLGSVTYATTTARQDGRHTPITGAVTPRPTPGPNGAYDPLNGLAPDGSSCNPGWTPFSVNGRFSGCVGQPEPITATDDPSVTFGPPVTPSPSPEAPVTGGAR